MRALLVILLFAGSQYLVAQDASVVVDWSTQTLKSSPLYINTKTPVTVHVQNVNDGLYTYVVAVSAKPREIDDFGKISTVFLVPAIAISSTCDASTKADIKAKVDTYAKTKALYPFDNGKVADVPWQDTEKAFNDKEGAKFLAEYALCKDQIQDITDAVLWSTRLTRIQEAKTSKHEFLDRGEMFEPEVDYDITVSELYEGQKVKDFNVPTIKPVSNVLTLSAGTLLSQLENRTYSTANSGTAAGTFLKVDGKGAFTPDLVALLNYRFPRYLSGDNFGLAISSGAALALNGSNVSRIGFFGGLSVYLWNRLYVTPGVHVGQFANFPLGLTQNQPIPSGYGALEPQKYYTARFGLAITYRAKDFTSLTTKSSQNSNQNTSQNSKQNASKPKSQSGTSNSTHSQSSGSGSQPQGQLQ